MSKWKKMTIGDFITLQRGHDLTNKEREIGNVPVYGAAGKNGYHSKSLANGPGLIIGRSGGSFGKVYFVKENYWPHNTSLYVTDFKENDPRFAFYLLRQMDLTSLNSGSAQPSLNRNYIYPLPIEVPEPYQQRKIAAVLSALDDKIEINNQINTELDHMAKALYDYWFVQFDFPGANGKPYKSAGGKMVYHELLKKEIPEGWGQEQINDLGTIVGGGTPSRSVDENFTNDGISWITPKDLSLNTGNKYITKGELDISEVGYKTASLNLLPAKSVLMSSRAPIGYLAINRVDCTTNQGFKSVVCNKAYPHEYVYYVLKNYMPAIEANATGSTFKEISAGVFKAIKIIKPKHEIVGKFLERVKPIFQKQDILEQQNQQLAALRDWLLPMLMNGQVKVNDNVAPYEADASDAATPPKARSTTEPLNIPANKKAFAKQVLAGKIVATFMADPNFTDIKFQKVQFIAEHLIEADLNLNYYYQAAGPYDNKFMHTIYDDLRKQKWFDCRNKEFIRLEKQGKIEDYYQGYFSPVQGQLDTLFDILFQVTEAEAEIIATVYAVWNNRIIEARQVTDEELIADFYQWSDRKQRYSKSQIENGIEFLRLNGIAPKGFGQLIKRAKNKN